MDNEESKKIDGQSIPEEHLTLLELIAEIYIEDMYHKTLKSQQEEE